MNRFLNAARLFSERHERLKNYVHTAWRYPLPKWGRITMGLVYFSIPVMGGYAMTQWAVGKSHESIGKHGEKLVVQEIEGIAGNVRMDQNGQLVQVGAGGFGGGVRLAVSDAKTQEQNKKMLEAFLKQQQKKKKQEKV